MTGHDVRAERQPLRHPGAFVDARRRPCRIKPVQSAVRRRLGIIDRIRGRARRRRGAIARRTLPDGFAVWLPHAPSRNRLTIDFVDHPFCGHLNSTFVQQAAQNTATPSCAEGSTRYIRRQREITVEVATSILAPIGGWPVTAATQSIAGWITDDVGTTNQNSNGPSQICGAAGSGRPCRVNREPSPLPVPVLQFFTRGDPARSHDVRSLPALAAECRRLAVRARHRHLPRDRAPMMEQVRAPFSRRYPPAAGEPHAGLSSLAMAPRRSLCED